MHDWSTRPQFLEPEQMDAAGVPRDRLAEALRFIRRVNWLFGYTRATIGHLDRLTRDWPYERPLHVLDVATGSADVPDAVAKWAKRRRIEVRCVGLDLHQVTLDYARQATDGHVPLVRGDALRLPFDDGAFDIVMTSMFTHHLPDALIIEVLREMDRVASRGIIVADLARGRRAYGWITLFTLLADPMVSHDARLSVRQALTSLDMESFARQAGITYAAARDHFGHRFVLSGRKTPGGTASATAPSGA